MSWSLVQSMIKNRREGALHVFLSLEGRGERGEGKGEGPGKKGPSSTANRGPRDGLLKEDRYKFPNRCSSFQTVLPPRGRGRQAWAGRPGQPVSWAAGLGSPRRVRGEAASSTGSRGGKRFRERADARKRRKSRSPAFKGKARGPSASRGLRRDWPRRAPPCPSRPRPAREPFQGRAAAPPLTAPGCSREAGRGRLPAPRSVRL